jgi:DNA-binding transcriptional ArsR family regulator
MALFPGQVIQVVDTISGEVLTTTSDPNAGVYMGKKRKHPGGFVIVYEEDFRNAALLLRGKGELPYALWNILFTKVEIGTGDIVVNTVELAELLKSHQPNISRTLKKLTELGLISQVRKDGKHFVYRINPSILWKGKEKERQNILTLVPNEKPKNKENS